jgi:hypothetical protein
MSPLLSIHIYYYLLLPIYTSTTHYRDNAFSWFTSKTLTYTVHLHQPAFAVADSNRYISIMSIISIKPISYVLSLCIKPTYVYCLYMCICAALPLQQSKTEPAPAADYN